MISDVKHLFIYLLTRGCLLKVNSHGPEIKSWAEVGVCVGSDGGETWTSTQAMLQLWVRDLKDFNPSEMDNASYTV